MGSRGIAETPDALPRAMATVAEAWPHYRSILNDFGSRLDHFIDLTQSHGS
jgi:hypothetical protein